MTSLVEKIYGIAKTIPKGKVMTYKQVATLAGNPMASRAVGYAMKSNPDMTIIPCHRVVGTNGKLVGYSGKNGIKGKRELLKKEGVVFKDENTIDLNISQVK